MSLKQLWKQGKVDTYQDLLFPNETLKGFRDCEKTWLTFSDLINFKGKTVLDVGCHHAYFLIQALRNGAKKTIGIDKNLFHNDKPHEAFIKPLEVAQQLCALWSFNDVELIEGDWLTVPFNRQVDVAFCFNTAHYFKSVYEGLKKLFQATRETLVFEIRGKYTPYLGFLSFLHRFKHVRKVNSHWNNRKIIVYKKK